MIVTDIYAGQSLHRYNDLQHLTVTVISYIRFSTAIIAQVAFGHQITTDDDPYIKITEGTGHAQSNAGSPGSTIVDVFPFRSSHIHCIAFLP